MSSLCGFFLVDKPVGPTSMTVVRKLKRHLAVEHAGHLGTLDPFASGLLPVLVGGATRLSDQVVEGRKGYRFRVALGAETDTLDPTGKVIQDAPVPETWRELARSVVPRFVGEIEQVPPLYSAIKMNGMALYEHMRAKGSLPRDIETKRRRITIETLSLTALGETEAWAEYEVVCSKGTYVRSLARDLAQAMGTVGHCATLRRTMVEPWRVEDAVELDAFLAQPAEVLVPRSPQDLLSHLPTLEMGDGYAKPLASGNGIICPAPEVAASLGLSPEASLPEFLFAGAAGVLFYAEVERLAEGQVRVQPRKRLR